MFLIKIVQITHLTLDSPLGVALALWIQEIANTQSQFLACTATSRLLRWSASATRWRRPFILRRSAPFLQRRRNVWCRRSTEPRWVPRLGAFHWWRTCNSCGNTRRTVSILVLRDDIKCWLTWEVTESYNSERCRGHHHVAGITYLTRVWNVNPFIPCTMSTYTISIISITKKLYLWATTAV